MKYTVEAYDNTDIIDGGGVESTFLGGLATFASRRRRKKSKRNVRHSSRRYSRRRKARKHKVQRKVRRSKGRRGKRPYPHWLKKYQFKKKR